MTTTAKILIIDDEMGIRAGCRRALTPQGYQVTEAADIAAGKELLQNGNFDLILLDVMMPDGRGIDLLPFIQAQDPETIIIIITGYATVELAVEAIRAGAYNFISKPFTAEVLTMVVNQGLEKRRLSLETQRLAQIEAKAAELARSKAELERLDQFKSDFVRLVAHELKSPLGGAQSLLNTMLAGLTGELTPQQMELLNRIDHRLTSLKSLVEDLLLLSAAKTLPTDENYEVIELPAVVTEIIDRYQVEAQQKNLTLSYIPPTESLWVTGKHSGYTKIFNNLIDNAIKYTPRDGYINVTAQSVLEEVEITITDSGIGIPAEALPELGIEFYRAPNARAAEISGTGLGLSIVHQFVDRFQGQMVIESEEGSGTTIRLLFPQTKLVD